MPLEPSQLTLRSVISSNGAGGMDDNVICVAGLFCHDHIMIRIYIRDRDDP